MYSFPVFIVCGGEGMVCENIVTLSAENPGDDAIALFTDRDAAEQYRDDHFSAKRVFEINTPDLLASLLTHAANIQWVAMDPLRHDARMIRVSKANVLQGLSQRGN